MTAPSRPRLVLVAAVAENGVIGHDGDMPWRLSSDLRRFRALTWGRPLIMGRRTFASIGKPLPGRDSVVVSRDRGFAPEGVTVVHDVEAALAEAARLAAVRGVDEVMVVGGGELYAALIGRADALRLTRVHAAPEGDVHFPPIDPARFRETLREGPVQGERDSAAVTFVDYERIEAPAEAASSQGAGR